MMTLTSSGQARAQCSFPHPKAARTFRASLVQSFIQVVTGPGWSCCAEANATTETGVPSLKPPLSFLEIYGNPSSSWRWGPQAQGSISLQAAKNTLVDPVLNPVPNTADVAVRLTLNGIQNATGIATGTGRLGLLCRATLEDRIGGDVTMIDFVLAVPVLLTDGRAQLKTTFNAALNSLYGMSLPGCTSLEILYAGVSDDNGAPFAAAGVFLPDINPN